MRVALAVTAALCWWTVCDAQEGAARVTTRVIREDDLDQARVEAIGNVVRIAKETLDALIPECAEKHIALQISPRDSWWPNTVTDRDRTIYVQLGEMGGRGIGEFGRGDAGPVGMLCEAVVELHNPQRIAGLDRYLAHRHLVPAVVEELGPWAIPSDTSTPMAADGEDMLELIADPTYASMHPNYAATAALYIIEDALGFDGLQALIAGIPEDLEDPFAALRAAAVAKDATIEQAFELHDEAAHVEVDEAGCVTLASFEEEETVTVVLNHPLPAVFDPLVLWPASLDAEQTDEWASDGDQSLKLSTIGPRPDLGIGISDPDWRLKDWSQFTRFDMDVRLEGDEAQAIRVCIEDDIAMGHGELALFGGVIQPGETRHIACTLDKRALRGYKSAHAEYYSGSFRWDEVALLMLLVKDPTQPFTLYIDDLRLSTGGVPQRAPAPTEADDEPAGGGRAVAQEFCANGRRLKGLGQHAAAAAELLRAIEADPGLVDARWVLAWVLVELDDNAGAVAAFEQVIRLAPESEEARQAQAAANRLR
ncbi:MAG TPA: tetratricopeptide repeat protein [Armatimonadota bacterium]|nr:tetratricopeptide repeat protein [Armatimonadota bacterium]